jgi:hypothetical protein
VQNFIHHCDGQQDADRVAGPVCIEVALVIVAVDSEKNSGFHNLKNNIGEKTGEDHVQSALDHEHKKRDLEHRTDEPNHVHHYPVHDHSVHVFCPPNPRSILLPRPLRKTFIEAARFYSAVL